MDNRIRQLRDELHLTLLTLSEQLKTKTNLKLSPDAIAKYERGDREPKLETWKELADFFDVTIGYIQGTSNIRTNLVDEVTEILFEKYIEHESYTNDKNETTIIFDSNGFHQKIDKYCDISNIDLQARSYSLKDENDESSEFNLRNDFQNKLNGLIQQVTLLYSFHLKPDNSGIVDEDRVIDIAMETVSRRTETVKKYKKRKENSLGGLSAQFKDLNNVLVDRERLITDKNWNKEDEDNLIDSISKLRKLSTEVLDEILKNL